jgi:hypothetical protein
MLPSHAEAGIDDDLGPYLYGLARATADLQSRLANIVLLVQRRTTTRCARAGRQRLLI